MRYVSLAAGVSGCGADGFFNIPPLDGSSEADSPAVDASSEELAADAWKDAPSVDGGEAAADARPCTAFKQDAGWTCMTTQGNFYINTPSQFCTSWLGKTTTPAACSKCVEDYSCACLIAVGATMCSSGSWSCTDSNQHLYAICQ